MSLVTSLSNVLVRQSWTRDQLEEGLNQSFFTPLMSTDGGGIINVRQNDKAGKLGHKVVFDTDGYLTDVAIEGSAEASGHGEDKRKFSSEITAKKFRHVVRNPDEYTAVQVGSYDLSMMSDASRKLMNKYYKWKDQWIFDVIQGNATHEKGHQAGALSHILEYNAQGATDLFSIKAIDDIISKILSGDQWDGGTSGSSSTTDGFKRMYPEEWMMSQSTELNKQAGDRIWVLLADPSVITLLRSDSNYQEISAESDMRGLRNRAFSRVIGRVSNLLIVEAPYSKSQIVRNDNVGTGTTNKITVNPNDFKPQGAGMRRMDANKRWTGQASYVSTGAQTSRCVLLGMNAVQLALGMSPDMKTELQDIEDHSETALEVWMNIQQTKLEAATEDYDWQVGGISNGIVGIDVKFT